MQSEFDAFNAVSAIKLPTGPNDNAGKANLLIEKRGGISSDGTSLPSTYSGSVTTIDPTDADIAFNSSIGRWEVSFDVTGFSSFFVKTSNTVLPLSWLAFSAGLGAQGQAKVNWEVQEAGVAAYQVEKSIDGALFTPLGIVPGKETG